MEHPSVSLTRIRFLLLIDEEHVIERILRQPGPWERVPMHLQPVGLPRFSSAARPGTRERFDQPLLDISHAFPASSVMETLIRTGLDGTCPRREKQFPINLTTPSPGTTLSAS
jgi:hypothetical protein